MPTSQVMKEVGRVLKPGGMVILSTSNRCFPTKASSLTEFDAAMAAFSWCIPHPV
jgi:2-polyprenyl-3-methyl-5-hydroxy-6-metoxy-1,4-benzoquinol methylase